MYHRLTSAEKKLIRIAKERPELKNKIASYLKKSSKESVVVFLETVLSERERNKLASWILQQEDTPNTWAGGWEVISHHMTVEFFGNKGRVENIPEQYKNILGEDLSLKVVGYVVDDKAIAVLIEPPSAISDLVKNRYPHITVAVNNEKPFYSNKLLKKSDKKDEIIRTDKDGNPINFSLRVKAGFFEGRTGKDTFELPM